MGDVWFFARPRQKLLRKIAGVLRLFFFGWFALLFHTLTRAADAKKIKAVAEDEKTGFPAELGRHVGQR
jgi:hypothetical protein